MITIDGKLKGLRYNQYRYERGDDFIAAYTMPKNKFIFFIPTEKSWLDEPELEDIVKDLEDGGA